MTTDTTMTDVDTSSEAIRKMQEDGGFYEKWVDRADAQLVLGKTKNEIHSFSVKVIVDADKIIDALAARCDELERLAERLKAECINLYSGGAERLAEHGEIVDPVETYIECCPVIRDLTAYQRKKERKEDDVT